MPGLYYEDYEIGAEFETPGRTIGETDLISFAAMTGDFNPIHTDEEYCKQSPFGTRIAHGLMGLAYIEGLKFRLGHFDQTAIATLGWNIKFPKPLLIGDTVHVKVKIANKRETSKPDRGILFEEVQLINQRGEVVIEGEHTVMVQRKKS